MQGTGKGKHKEKTFQSISESEFVPTNNAECKKQNILDVRNKKLNISEVQE